MADFTFRLRFRLPESTALNIEESSLDLSGAHHPSLSLVADQKETPIKEAKGLVLKGAGHPSMEAALSTGERLRDSLTLALAYCRIGADFGDRGGRGGFTHYGLRMLEESTGHKVLTDVHGLMAFETDPPPKLARLGEPTLVLGTPAEKFVRALALAAATGYRLTERERLSFLLFTTSFFERAPEARLLFLVMSVEALTDPQPSPPAVVAHVDTLMTLTRNAASLPMSERQSLLGSLNWLHQESIRQASRGLISSRIGGNTYDNMPGPDFFLRCYDLRSDVVHGAQPYPTRDQVGIAAANLEVLVANLIASCIDWAAA